MNLEQKIERIMVLQKSLAGEKTTRKYLAKNTSIIDAMLARMEAEFKKQEEFAAHVAAKNKEDDGESADAGPLTSHSDTGGGRRIIRKPGGL
jgi:septal ring factor EnvC (AmiA/AmiB activator)